MKLDARQRALLREIGVRVWWPTAAPDAASPEPSAAGSQSPQPAASGAQARRQGAPEEAVRKATAPTPPPAAPAKEPAAAATGWQLGPLQALYGAADSTLAQGPRWLLLAEQRNERGSTEIEQLLLAMLRAAGLHQGHTVYLAPLLRTQAPAGVAGLEDALAQSAPDLVFIMGRLGAQALLESTEPLGQLRGQIHELWGLPAVASYDSATLLRHPVDKAKAWDDLCLALQVARSQLAERTQSEEP